MKLRCMALDSNANQALEISLSKEKRKYIINGFDISSLATGKGAINLIVSSHLNSELLKSIEALKGVEAKNILIYPDSQDSSKLVNDIIALNLIPSPIKIESLTTLALSTALDIYIDILIDDKEDNIIFGEEEPSEIFKEGYFVSSWSQSASSIESCMLSITRRVWELYSSYGVAMAIHVAPEMTLITLDELLDLIESRITPQTKIYIVYKNDLAKDEKPYINLLFSRYLPQNSSFQDVLDKEEGYLSKVALIVDWANSNIINIAQAEQLAKDNGIEVDDLYKIYGLIYDYPQVIAKAIKDLREAQNSESRVDIIAKSLKDGSIDTIILEELAHTYNLSVDSILEKVEMLSKE